MTSPSPPRDQSSFVSTPAHVLHPSSTDRSQAFKPFFTVIADDTASNSHRQSLTKPVYHNHPFVHYLFADDSNREANDVLTAAFLATLSTTSEKQLPSSLEQSTDAISRAGANEFVGNTANDSSIGLRKERYLIVDMGQDGKSILQAKSLSRDWQVLKAEIRSAPSFAGNNEGTHGSRNIGIRDTSQDAASMLWIEGLNANKQVRNDDEVGDLVREQELESPLQRVERLAKDFERERSMLREWMGAER